MDRRTFLSWVGMGWVASSLPIALAACSPDPSASNPSTSNQSKSATPNKQFCPTSPARSDGFVKVGTTAELEAGAIVLPKSAIGPVAVVRHQGVLAAVNPTCTHQGCIVAWQASEYVCPCHQAKFSATGGVLQPPAKVPLKVYQVQIEGSDVLVKTTI
jgi:cytochrome b6-f complex iron-sulfur subunit